MAVVVAPKGVHVDGGGLSRTHLTQLRLFIVGRHPEIVQVDEGHQRLARLQHLAGLHSLLADDAIEGGPDGGVLQVELGQIEGRLGARHLRIRRPGPVTHDGNLLGRSSRRCQSGARFGHTALRVGDRVSVQADAERRARIMRNHSGTHLVHAALRNILGTHVKQAGSLNAPDRLRFDFSHFAHVDAEELRDIEQQVNDEIRHNTQVETDITNIDNALASGALAFFGDKYPDANVRVVTIPDERAPRGFYSKELCGGTHVHKIGDIGVLKIVSEESVAAGVRRVEAITGIGALEHYQHQASVLASVAKQLNVGEEALLAQIEKLIQTVRQLEKLLTDQRRKGALNQLDDLVAKAQTIKGTKVVVSEVENVDREALRQLVDSLRQKLGSGVVVLGQAEDGKVALIAGVTKDLTAKVHAGKVIQAMAKLVNGKGGGRPDLAEGGGEDTKALNSTLGGVPALLEGLL